MKTRTLFAAALALACPAVFAQPVSPETKAKLIEQISKLISTEVYVGGVDFSKWDGYLESHRSEIDKAETSDQFAAAINRAFAEFGFSHLSVLTPRATTTQMTGQSVGIGILAETLPEGVRVSRVLPGGPASKAGLKEGELIYLADGKPVKGPENIRGEKGTVVELEIRKPDGTEYKVTIVRDTFSVLVEDELKWIDDKTAMIVVNTFAVGYKRDQINKFFDEIKEKGAENLIIDLRSNGGGSTINLFHLAGKIMPGGTPMGKFITRGHANNWMQKHPGKDPNPVEIAKEFGLTLTATGPKDPVYTGKVVVLTSPVSASASEIFAATVLDHARGKVIGAKTAGAVLASRFAPLPEGWAMQIPLMEYVTTSGKRLEAVGVTPSVAVGMPELAQDDAVLKVAMDTLKSMSAWAGIGG
jgi:carboxyl-terminal processing protease